MIKTFTLNNISFKADPVKTKKLYAKQVPNISTANGDDVTIYLLAKKHMVIKSFFEKLGVNIDCPFNYGNHLYFPVVGEIISYGKDGYEEVDVYAEQFYKKLDLEQDNLNLAKVKIDFGKNNFYCSLHLIKDTPYTRHNNKMFYIAIEEN
ncbi:MAG: hypothetical protein IJE91_02320 [Clostridia bacterium]|nr:hypothetical protein [Clostridia bacterium]